MERLGTKDNCDKTSRPHPATTVSCTTAASSTTVNQALLISDRGPDRSADAKTAAANAANLKASQRFIMDQCVIDCSPRIAVEPFKSGKPGSVPGFDRGGEEMDKTPSYSQFRKKHTSSPDAH